MLTSLALVLGVIALYRVKSRNARTALFVVPLYRALWTLIVGTPVVDSQREMMVFVGLKLPDLGQPPLHDSEPVAVLPIAPRAEFPSFF